MRGRRVHDNEHGLTLVELTVAVGLLSLVAVVFLPIMAGAMRSLRPLQAQSEAVDELRLVLTNIGRELRSARCITVPTANAPAGDQLRFTTQANNSAYEVTYTAAGGRLERQVTGAAAPRVVASGLVDTADTFAQVATPRRTVKVRFHAQPDPDRPARDLETTVTGRNAWRDC